MRTLAVILVGLGLGACGSSAATTTSAGGAGGGVGGGGGTPINFDCLGKVQLPAATMKTAPFHAVMRDGLTQQPIAGMKLSACNETDPACKQPVSVATSAADGTYTLTLPLGANGFAGYGQAVGAGYYPLVIQSDLPTIPVAGRVYAYDATPLQVGVLFAQAFGVKLEPTKGVVSAVVYDCLSKAAAGATLTIGSSGAILGYAQGAGYSLTAKETDATGHLIALQIEPGEVEVSATLAATGQPIGKGTVVVRAGGVSNFYLFPSP